MSTVENIIVGIVAALVAAALVVFMLVLPASSDASTRAKPRAHVEQPDRVDRLQARVQRLQRVRGNLRERVRELRNRNVALRSELHYLRTEQHQSVPGIIRAVPVARLRELVLEPAREVWQCDTYSEFSPDRWLMTFDSEWYCAF